MTAIIRCTPKRKIADEVSSRNELLAFRLGSSYTIYGAIHLVEGI